MIGPLLNIIASILLVVSLSHIVPFLKCCSPLFWEGVGWITTVLLCYNELLLLPACLATAFLVPYRLNTLMFNSERVVTYSARICFVFWFIVSTWYKNDIIAVLASLALVASICSFNWNSLTVRVSTKPIISGTSVSLFLLTSLSLLFPNIIFSTPITIIGGSAYFVGILISSYYYNSTTRFAYISAQAVFVLSVILCYAVSLYTHKNLLIYISNFFTIGFVIAKYEEVSWNKITAPISTLFCGFVLYDNRTRTGSLVLKS